MAILKSGDMSLEVRFCDLAEQDGELFVYYDIWLRCQGHNLINPILFKRQPLPGPPQPTGSLRAADPLQDNLIPLLSSVMEKNQPDVWQLYESGIQVYFYPDMYFPPLRKQDFDQHTGLSFFAGEQEAQLAKIAAGEHLPNEYFSVFASADSQDLGAGNSGGNFGLRLELLRWGRSFWMT
jgi:hypothetical protein